MEQLLLSGAYDLHIHTAPDITQRKCDDEEFAIRAEKAGMAGFVIKCHYAETASRSRLLQKKFPSLTIAGGIVLNRQAGGINPYAVEYAAKMGARFLWFPTLDSKSYQQYHHPQAEQSELESFVDIWDHEKVLLENTHKVLQLAAKYNLVVGTGHLSALEGLAIVKAAKEHSVEHVVLTHCDNPATFYTLEQRKKAVALGAMIEHCCFTLAKGYTPANDMAEQIKSIGAENIILTSDLGQTFFPYPDKGFAQGITQLLNAGVTQQELTLMLHQNPKKLIFLLK